MVKKLDATRNGFADANNDLVRLQVSLNNSFFFPPLSQLTISWYALFINFHDRPCRMRYASRRQRSKTWEKRASLTPLIGSRLQSSFGTSTFAGRNSRPFVVYTSSLMLRSLAHLKRRLVYGFLNSMMKDDALIWSAFLCFKNRVNERPNWKNNLLMTLLMLNVVSQDKAQFLWLAT